MISKKLEEINLRSFFNEAWDLFKIHPKNTFGYHQFHDN